MTDTLFRPEVIDAQRDRLAGMALAADLVLEKRRLWEVFLDPVLKALAR